MINKSVLVALVMLLVGHLFIVQSLFAGGISLTSQKVFFGGEVGKAVKANLGLITIPATTRTVYVTENEIVFEDASKKKFVFKWNSNNGTHTFGSQGDGGSCDDEYVKISLKEFNTFLANGTLDITENQMSEDLCKRFDLIDNTTDSIHTSSTSSVGSKTKLPAEKKWQYAYYAVGVSIVTGICCGVYEFYKVDETKDQDISLVEKPSQEQPDKQDGDNAQVADDQKVAKEHDE